ncbi:MAG: SO_0444 family Cu/Zn efflux transporter [Clostridia bacterium]
MEILKAFCLNFLEMFIGMSFYIMLGLFFVGILNVYVNRENILKHFGAKNFSAVLKASAAGVPLPLCSCGVVPTAVELKRGGASNGAVISFLISTPQTGVDSILATYSMMGAVMAIFRPLAAFCSGLLGGAFVNMFAKDTEIMGEVELSCCCSSEPVESTCCSSSEPVESECSCSSEPVESACSCSSEPVESACSCSSEPVESACCCSSEPIDKSVPKFKLAMQYSYGKFLDEIAGHFMVGMVLATLIATFLPADFFVSLGFDSGILGMVAMVLVGLPMYICSSSSIPIALALMAKGLSAGSAFVFLFTGPVTNIASMVVLSKTLGKKITAMYTLVVVFCSMLFGIILDYILIAFDINIMSQTHIEAHGSHTNPLSIVVSIIFAILIAKSFYKKYKKA